MSMPSIRLSVRLSSLSIQNPFRVPPPTTTKKRVYFSGGGGRMRVLKAYESVTAGPSISCGLLFTAHGKCLCFAVVHALLWMCTYLTLSLGQIRQISMATEATASMWRTLEDALGPSCNEWMHLSCKLNCTRLASRVHQISLELLCKYMESNWNLRFCARN